jgi:membrane-associated phospholipid phosphatase
LSIRSSFVVWVLSAGLGLSTLAKAQTQTNAGGETSDTSNLPAAPQTAPSVSKLGYVPEDEYSRPGFVGHIKDFVEDQKTIWTSPFEARLSDTTWLVPLAGITAGLFVTDRQFSASLSRNPSTISHCKTASDYGIAAMIGAGASMYLFSFPTHNEHWRETGFLAGEAALNSLVTVEVMKYSLGRERPYESNGSGRFFRGGTSFPSEHATAAWSIAGVVAHEYPGTLPKLLAYGMASAISLSRVKARQHFPSDVLIGSVLGYLISQNIYKRHHDPEIAGGAWESPRELVTQHEEIHTPPFMGSPYVPLDSWIYPAMERLAALGYLKTVTLGLRPWTRLECARLLAEAGEQQPDVDAPLEVQQLYDALSEEFAHDSEQMSGDPNADAQLESVYTRALGISGKPLTDNYHFGQTLLNDYGRPYEQGFNALAGTSGYTTIGPFVLYARGEYQSAPSAPSLPSAALNFISNTDGLPPNPPSLPVASISRFQFLDIYAGLNLANWQLSFGRRSLWWGPSEGGTMLFTNNAAPLNKMFSIDRVSPFQLPWIFRYLGDIRFETFIGQTSGQEFVRNVISAKNGIFGTTLGHYGESLRQQPFISGEKVSFKVNENFEISLSKTTLYGGPQRPLTPKTLIQSTFGLHVGQGVYADVLGDGRTAADFSYRVPGMRDWLTFYGEAFSEDEISPIPYIRKSIFQGGLYFPKLPGARRVDLRLEGGTTSPVQGSFCTSCFYTNGEYVNGYTNDGHLIGTWIGRAAQGELVRSNYWMSPRTRIGIEFRHRQIDAQYLPLGGTQNDVGLDADIFAGSGFRFTGNLQYERWQIPLLATNRQSNVVASFEFGFWPKPHTH